MGPKRLWLPRVFALALLCAAGDALLRIEPTLGHQPPLRQPSVGLGWQQAGPQIVANYGKLPLSFEANQGQVDSEVKFLSRGRGYTLFLTGTEAVLQLRISDFGLRNANSANPQREARNPRSEIRNPKLSAPSAVQLRLRLLGANPQPEVRGLDELPGKSNYFIGNDPSKWRTNVPTYARVEYRDVYPGVSLVHYGNQQQLEYDFVVSPGADPGAIEFEAEGAERIEIDDAGDLVMHVPGGEVRQHKPIVYQQIAGHRLDIPGRFVLRDPAFRTPHSHRVGFEVGAYDPSRPLVVDPVLVYSTYLGGSGDETEDFPRPRVAADASGAVYMTGWTTSANFPTAAALRPALGGGRDAFVAKFNPAGSALVYSTYLGGSADDEGRGIAVDAAGNAYVTGKTLSTNFPTAAPIQASLAGQADIFVAKLNPAGSALVYSTYLGGAGNDWGVGIAVDASGGVYVTGETGSTTFLTVSPMQASNGGGIDAFVVKLNAAGSALVYSTYLGGSNYDTGVGIAVDADGAAYVTGQAGAANFPTANPIMACGSSRAFVTKLSGVGSLVYSTCLGGPEWSYGIGIAVDTAGAAYVSGSTQGGNMGTPGAAQPNFGGGQDDAFACKLNAAGSALVYFTYIGGNAREGGHGIAVDANGAAYVGGWTSSSNFPVVNPVQSTYGGGGSDAFVAKVDPAGSRLLYSTYLGGSGGEYGNAIALDGVGGAYVTGWTDDISFPTVNALQPTRRGNSDYFLAKIAEPGTGCSYSISPASQSLAAAAASGSVAVTAASGCTWAATSNASWITITSGSSGSGSGTVEYSVAANSSAGSRAGTVTIAGQTFTVNQAGATACSYAIAPTSASVPAAGGTASVTVTAASGCTWTAVSTASWITITSGASGSGNGTVNYTVGANSSAGSRAGTVTIAGQTFTVTQAAAATLNVSPTTLNFTAQRGGASPPVQGLQVTASDASSIPWTATSSAAWLSVSPASGNTPANVSVSVNIAGLAAGNHSGQVSFVSGSGTPVAVSVSVNVSETPAVIGVSPASLQFTTSVGVNPSPQALSVTNPGGGTLNWGATIFYSSSAGWLSVTPAFGVAPTSAAVSVDVNAAVLRAGTYQGQILISALGGATNSPLSMPVALTVTSAAQLAVSPQFLSFQATQGGSAAVWQALSITNAGSGALNWTASATTSNGGDWLKLSATQGAAPAAVTVSANPAGLPAGVYLGSIRIADVAGGGSVTVIVALTINPPATTILLSQSDFVFTTVESSASPLRQSLRILNIGQGTLAWRLLATIPSGGNWLSVEQASGSSTTDPATAAPIGVLVSPAGLAAGNYYGLLIVSSSGATNSPQLASVHLRVLPSTSAPKPSVLPSGFIFAASDGGASPAPQVFSVQNLGGGALPFKASASTADGFPWLSVSPSQTNAPATMTVQANSANLRAGVYRGTIALDFPAGLTQELSVVLVITPLVVAPSAFNGPEERAAGCTPTELQAVSTYLPNNFLSLVGWPVPIMVRVVDNCNNAVTGATVVASFLGAESAPLVLKALRDGLYTGTWVPLSNARVRVSIKALNPPLKEASIEMLSQPADFTANLPLINPDGVVNGASFDARTPVAPGSIISLFGRNLVPQPIPATGLPLPTNLAGLAMKIGDRDAPLFYANNGQVNAQVPVELASNTATSVVLTMNGKVSPPEPLLLSPVQPGIFTYDDGGVPHAAALDEKNALVGKANPAVRGTIIQVYATGLGPTDPAVKTGEPGPSNPAAVLVASTQLTATMGGVPAEIQFKGLAPGYVGLYQVNLRVPSGVPSGDLPLVITANGLPSKEAMLPVK